MSMNRLFPRDMPIELMRRLETDMIGHGRCEWRREAAGYVRVAPADWASVAQSPWLRPLPASEPRPTKL